jgi:hypothetical protein
MGVQIPLMIPRPHRDVGYCPEFTRDLMRGGGGGLLFVEAPPTPMSGLGPRLLAVAWDPRHSHRQPSALNDTCTPQVDICSR